MSLIDRLRQDFPQFQFKKADVCRWSTNEQTIFYADNNQDLLHELGHALSGHKNFHQDIELIHMERDAWEKARELGLRYNIPISDTSIENAMESYRDWLHQRSLCPCCQQTGIQNHDNLEYYCINCNTHWRANDARQCRLKRQTLNKNRGH